MQRRWMLMTLAGIAGAMLTGCATTERPAPVDALNDTGWTLSALRGKPVLSWAQPTLQFEGGRVQGSDGCNRYGAPYSAAGSGLKVSDKIAATRMACAEPVMRQGEAFLRALLDATAFRKDARELTLLDAGGAALASLSAQSMDLRGTSWRVTGYNNGKQAVASTAIGTELTAEFSADGRLSGTAGCNNYTAIYTTSGKSIRIERAAATRKMCDRPKGVMEQEALFLAALPQAAAYRIEGNRLELRAAGGALVATLAAVRKP